MKSKFRFIFIALAITSGSAHADIIGAGIGGLIGSQFGQGNGKIAMAALGAVIGDRVTEGAYGSNRISSYGDDEYQEVRPRPAPRAYAIPTDPQIVRVTPVTPAQIHQPYYGSVGAYVYPSIVIGTHSSYGFRQHPGQHRGHHKGPRYHH